jgi:putative ABC transport system permease protein
MAATADAASIGGKAARWMILGEWRAHPGRVIVATIAIAVGVALGFAVHLINASALSEFARAVASVNGAADLQVRAKSPLGFDEALYPKLARLDGIAAASPVVELRAVADIAGGEPMTLLGLDMFRVATVTPSLIVRASNATTDDESDNGAQATSGEAFSPNSLFLSQAALDATGKRIGEMIELTASGRTIPFEVSGTLPVVEEDQSIAVMDIADAQWRFDALGRLHRVDLKLAPGMDAARMRATITAFLPSDAELVTQESEARRTDSLSRAYRVNLDMLALMALLTGAFLVYSAQSLSVTRRSAQFALLRVLGVYRRGLIAQVLTEGAIVGAIGAIVGLAVGLLIADAGLRLLGGDLGGGYFSGTRPQLAFAPWAALTFFVLGVGAALVGSLLPAREVARAQPAIALRDVGDAADPKARPHARLALSLLLAGTVSAFLPAIGELPLFGYLSIALLLAGGIAAMPLLARLLLTPLQRFGHLSASADLALKRLWGAPSQAAIALGGIVASTSLMIAMAVMVWSFRGSVDEWLVQVLPADIYLRLEGDSSLDAEVQKNLLATPGVASINFRKMIPLRLSAERPAVILVAQSIDSENPTKTLPIIGATFDAPPGTTAVWVSEPAMRLYGYQAGQTIDLPIAGRNVDKPAKFFVAGIWRDYGRQQGAITMDATDYTTFTGDRTRTDGSVELAPAATAGQVIEGLRAALPQPLAERIEFALPGELRALSLQIFDRSFAVTYLLEAIAILVGLAGVAATFSAQTLARTKEFGMLRHLGVTRRQIIAMLLMEGALLGAVGVIAGIGLGLAMSQVLIHVVNPQSFNWTMETRLPFVLFATVTVALIGAAAATALLAGRRALSLDAVRAVREDW